LIDTEIFYSLLLIALALIFSRLLGFLFYKIKQPAVIGEIVAGIFLGGIVLYLFSGYRIIIGDYYFPIPTLSYHCPEFDLLAEIGILFLLFISGLETDIIKLRKTGKTAALVAFGGVIVPLGLGFLSGIFFGIPIQGSIMIGLILIATSVGVSVRTLMDLSALDTNVGATILGAAVIDDIIGIILLAFVLGLGSVIDAIWIGVRIILFFLIFLYLGLKIIDRILDIGEKIHLPKAFLSIAISIFLLYAFFADRAGISGIIGAFVAGLLIGQNFRSKKIIDDVKAIGYGFFIPIFFVWVGTSLWTESIIWTVDSFMTIALFSIVIISIGIASKIAGCSISAKIAGLSSKESLIVGFGMIPRMELALIISAAAISNGLIRGVIAYQILTVTILLTFVTTILGPILIKTFFKKYDYK
jgi:Kef-type K+ transport system membrane component KefB